LQPLAIVGPPDEIGRGVEGWIPGQAAALEELLEPRLGFKEATMPRRTYTALLTACVQWNEEWLAPGPLNNQMVEGQQERSAPAMIRVYRRWCACLVVVK